MNVDPCAIFLYDIGDDPGLPPRRPRYLEFAHRGSIGKKTIKTKDLMYRMVEEPIL
jgi:hypothetical protein